MGGKAPRAKPFIPHVLLLEQDPSVMVLLAAASTQLSEVWLIRLHCMQSPEHLLKCPTWLKLYHEC